MSEITSKLRGNGLVKYSCQVTLYTANDVYQLLPPEFSADPEFSVWDLGFLDVKNVLFYELGQMSEKLLDRTLFFREWINLLEIFVNKKVHEKFFEFFNFQNSSLVGNNRYLHEPEFFSPLRRILQNPKNSKLIWDDSDFNSDFLVYVCNLFKTYNNLIAYTLLKKKICSNLKNFKDLTFTLTKKK